MTQISRILGHMKATKDHSITSMEAFQKFGATRLSAVIFELRKRGYDITSIPEESVNRYGEDCKYVRYRLNMKSVKSVEK
jgi:hypothetical protein